MSYSEKIYPEISSESPSNKGQAYRPSKIDGRNRVAERDQLSERWKRQASAVNISDFLVITTSQPLKSNLLLRSLEVSGCLKA